MRNGESSKAGDATRATSLALVEAFRDLLAEHLTELELLLIKRSSAISLKTRIWALER